MTNIVKLETNSKNNLINSWTPLTSQVEELANIVQQKIRIEIEQEKKGTWTLPLDGRGS